jgi:hypothetical protein
MSTLSEMFEAASPEFLKFERIKNPPSTRPDICAFLLLDKLCPGSGDIVEYAEHDQYWIDGEVCKRFKKVATMDDVVYLTRCGIVCDEEDDCLFSYT